MEETTTVSAMTSTDIVTSSLSKYEGLIDIPISEKIIDSLISLFNYFDIYAPRMSFVYTLVTFFRFFQLIGGSFMAANLNSFTPGTFTFKVMSIITVLFHIVPLEYRRGNGYIVCYIVNSILITFAIYLIITAMAYKKSSKVPQFSKIILSLFLAVCPFLMIPISAQYTGQMLSGYISKDVQPSLINNIAIATTFIAVLAWMWIIIKAYSIALVFRQCSFQSIEGGPQNKLLITTTVVTFASALTTNLGSIPSAAMMILSILLYIYCTTTVFNCATFVLKRDQILAFGGSIFGILLCGANLYTVFAENAWNAWFFAGVGILAVIVFITVSLYFKGRMKRELRLLDEIDDTQDIHLVKSIGKFKQILPTGYMNCHPVCVSFKIFKLAATEWKDELGIWSLYAKFVAIYPEQSTQLAFIAQNVAALKTNKKVVQAVILSSTGDIIKTRETKFTQQLKAKISKLSKLFNKTKGRLRNIWDLTLQGNIQEMNSAIKNTLISVQESENEMNHLLMQYHNNKYVMRQNVMFLNYIKGDPIAAKEAAENLAKLQRGVSIADDTIHDLGMLAFPNIPEACLDAEGSKITETESNLSMDDYIIDDSLDIEAIRTISKQIDNHKIPSIRYIYWSTIIAFFLIIFAPLVAMVVAYYPYSSDLEIPVSFMKGIAYTRSIMAMLTGYTSRLLLTKIDDPKHPGQKIEGDLEVMESLSWKAFGGNKKTQDVIQYIAQHVGASNSAMTPIRSYKSDNKYMEKVRDLIFTDITNFSYYINNTYSVDRLSSISDISFMLANTVGKLCDYDVITAEDASGPDSLTSRNNLQNSLLGLNEALETMILYLKELNEKYQMLFLIIIIVCIALNIIIYPIIFIIQVKKLRRNRYEILYILTTLPKTVISNISASFTKVKGDDKMGSSSCSDIEQSKQEESIIKLFSSISDGSSKASIELVIGFCIFLLIAMGCSAYYVSMSCYINSSNNVVYNCHHINYLFGASAYLFSIMASIFKIALAKYDPIFENSIVSLDSELTNIGERIPTLVTYFQFIRLGGVDIKEIPFSQMQSYITKASKAMTCYNISEPPKVIMDSTHCMSAAQQLYVATCLMKKYYGLMMLDPPIYPDAGNEDLPQLWQIGPIELYITFFWEAGESIVPIIVDNISSGDSLQNTLTIIIILAGFFVSLIIMIAAKSEDNFLKFCLRLFLRCPPMATLSNQRVMDLLSGNYNYTNQNESHDKFTKYSSDVINKLNDIIIVCQEETSKVISVNTAFEEMFRIKQSEIENKPIKEFFTTDRFQCTEGLDKVFTQTVNLIYKKQDSEKVYLEFSTNCFSGRRIFSGSNQTQNVMHEKLIADEKKKSDSMLASILPPMLVPRVQAGEKNISFSVQSVTVLFLDVVEFTPWCGSHDAQYVMRMLNIMFKEFDAITNAHKTMTKIKCIGDCYMAAGGIFDEVNQPAVHAKEVVDFGCLVIKKLLEIDENENETLRIRVGINTGGPIVAGVIGTEKPTFEILGPAINIAHEMEHHGVPMKVHISRPVYELIYGQQFDIKERGEIDVKGGKMFTYLVEP